MRRDLNFEAEFFAGYEPSQKEGFDPSMPYWRPPGSHRWGFRRRSQRWPWLQMGSGFGGEYEAPFYESEADVSYETGPAGSARDRALVTEQIGRGIKDENKLTDAVFYQRQPAWKGKALKNAGVALRREWVQIRDGLVRPLLKSAPSPTKPSAPPTPVPPAPPVQPTQPDVLPSSRPGAGINGYNTFDNIKKYFGSGKQREALAAQAAFQKVKGFLPYYRRIMNAVPTVSIGLDLHGIGNLVFYMDKRGFAEMVQSKELLHKIEETIGSGLLGRLEFTVDVIGLVGLGATLVEIAHGIEKERMVGGVGPKYDQWRRDQAFKFVIGLLAEDLSRQNLSGSYFAYRNVRDLVNEITADLAEFKPLNDAFVTFLLLEDQFWRSPPRPRGDSPDLPEPPIMREPPRMYPR